MLKQVPVGFGYYRMGDLLNCNVAERIEKEFARGYLNTYIVELAEYCVDKTIEVVKALKKFGAYAWLYIPHVPFTFGETVTLNPNWEQKLEVLVDRLKEEGLYDSLAGFYFDEPLLCGATKEMVKEVTRKLREGWPDMRVMIIFATNAIAPEVWSNNGKDQVLDPDCTQYITDAGYDMYWDVRETGVEKGIDKFETVNRRLKERLGRDDVKIWYVPCVMSYHSTSDEEYAIAHTEAMYDFLKNEKNQGGLMCYAYDIHDRDGEINNIGFDILRTKADSPWVSLEKRLIEIGKEIINK